MVKRAGSTYPRCRAHGLATGPEGRCALCRRASSAPEVAPADPVYADESGVTSTLLGAGALIAAAAALAFALSVADDFGHAARAPFEKARTGAGPARPRPAERSRSNGQGREGVVVVMYSTSWCPSCLAARSYMDRQGIAYVEHDIDQDSSARAQMQRLNPRGSVPTIDVQGEVLVGFDSDDLEYALEKAARRRAGI